jgi:hypothetical protein
MGRSSLPEGTIFFLTAKIAITQEGSKGNVHELTDEIHLVCPRRSDLDVLPVLLLSSADIHPRRGRIASVRRQNLAQFLSHQPREVAKGKISL